MRRSGAEGPQRGRYTCGTTGTNMAREEDLMKQVEELKRKLREAEEEKEEIWRRRKEARGGEYMMRESDAGGIASRAMGSAVHMGQLGIDNNNNYRSFFVFFFLSISPLSLLRLHVASSSVLQPASLGLPRAPYSCL